MSKQILTGCGNCYFCQNSQCTYAGVCYGSTKWSNALNCFVPITYVETDYSNWGVHIEDNDKK